MNGGWDFRRYKVLMISLILISLALACARAHAESRLEVLEAMQAWKFETSNRLDLEDREQDLRIDFINRLIFQTERKYQEESLKEFLLKTLKEMISTDQRAQNQSFATMNDFLESLQISLSTLIEKNEKPLVFIENFTEFSGITEPASPDEFSETRSYYDGKNIAAAHTMTVDEAADFAEAKEIEAEKALKDPAWTPLHQNLMDEYKPKVQKDSVMM